MINLCQNTATLYIQSPLSVNQSSGGQLSAGGLSLLTQEKKAGPRAVSRSLRDDPTGPPLMVPLVCSSLLACRVWDAVLELLQHPLLLLD